MKHEWHATKCQDPITVCSWWRLIVPLYDENLSGVSNLLVFHCARTFSWAEPRVEPSLRRSRKRIFVAEQCEYLDGSIIASFTPLRCVVTCQIVGRDHKNKVRCWRDNIRSAQGRKETRGLSQASFSASVTRGPVCLWLPLSPSSIEMFKLAALMTDATWVWHLEVMQAFCPRYVAVFISPRHFCCQLATYLQ